MKILGKQKISTNKFTIYTCVFCKYLYYLFLIQLFTVPTEAQVIPDTTLSNNSFVTKQETDILIEGGTRAGNNLFHSFSEFSVPSEMTAYFNNTLDIKNIFTRITGNSISNIDGILRTNGNVNLFLINANGINFGQNTRLDIGGSFFSTTANSIKFADGFQFTTNTSQSTASLTINIPIGLQFGNNPGVIHVQGKGHNVSGLAFSPVIGRNSSSGLQVKLGKTIAIVGGNVILDGGIVTAEGGRVELGSVGNNAFVRINTIPFGWNLSYENVPSFQDIQLSTRALVDASGIRSGSINIQGRRLTLVDGSLVLIQNQGTLPGGTLNVNASDSLDISGTDPIAKIGGSLRNETVGSGKAGNITVSTAKLILRNGGQINALTYSAAKSGNVIVNASDSVNLFGSSPRNPNLLSLISTGTFSVEDAGNIIVSTARLVATDGGAITSSTFGSGKGGDVIINATDSVTVTGFAPIISQPSVLSATTLNIGNAGNLAINTSTLKVQNGGRIDASTLASGNSGSITINASDSVVLSGIGFQNPSLVISSADILAQNLQNLYKLPPAPSGSSGNITINTNNLTVVEGAQVSVTNDGTGDAGTLKFNANSIELNNGYFSASTASGEGGNILVNSRHIKLRNNSNITTTAQDNGNGGNININTDILFAVDNNNITANAFKGRGGNIHINAKAIFLSPNSRITASSQLGIDGTVQINTSERYLNQVPVQSQSLFVTPEIASVCQGRTTNNSQFITTGTGGLQPSPGDSPDIVSVWQRNTIEQVAKVATQEATPIIEAQGWIKRPNGSIVLTAEPNVIDVASAKSSNACKSETTLTQDLKTNVQN